MPKGVGYKKKHSKKKVSSAERKKAREKVKDKGILKHKKKIKAIAKSIK